MTPKFIELSDMISNRNCSKAYSKIFLHPHSLNHSDNNEATLFNQNFYFCQVCARSLACQIVKPFTKILKPFDISSQQYNVLRILRGQGGNAISVNNIMSRMIDKMSNTSRLVEKLRKKELVERVVCEHDRRQVDIRITEKVLKLLEKCTVEMDQFDNLCLKISKKEYTVRLKI